MIPNDKRDPVNATIDTVGGAISMLWDWLGASPKSEIVKASSSPERAPISPPAKQPADGPGLCSHGPSERSGASRAKRDDAQRIPPIVIDTEGTAL